MARKSRTGVLKRQREMKKAADKLEFERAAELRDRIRELKQHQIC